MSNAANEFFERGMKFWQEGKLKESIKEFSAAIKKEKRADFYGARGRAYFALGDDFNALNDFDRAIDLSPEDAQLWYCRGLAYNQRFEYEKAIEDFDQANKLDSQLAEACIGKAMALSESGKHKAALAEFDSLIRQNPTADLFSHRGWCHWNKNKRSEQANKDFRRAIDMEPDNPLPYYFLGRRRIEQNELLKGLKLLRKAKRLFTERGGNVKEKADIDRMIDDFEEVELTERRKHSLPHMSLEEQLQSLEKGGIRLREGIPIDLLLHHHTRKDYEHDPIQLLVEVLASEATADGEPICNDVFMLDEGMLEDGEYKEIFEKFRDIAHGSLPITEITDYAEMEDDVLQTQGKAEVSFQLDGKTIKWKERSRMGYFYTLLTRLADLFARRKTGKRFTILPVPGIIGCATDEQLQYLREKTLLNFQWLE